MKFLVQVQRQLETKQSKHKNKNTPVKVKSRKFGNRLLQYVYIFLTELFVATRQLQMLHATQPARR